MTEQGIKSAREMYYDSDYRESIRIHCEKEYVHTYDWRLLVMVNDAEILNEALQNPVLMDSFAQYQKLINERTLQEVIDKLIDLAIECKSYECYVLLVEYKRKHNLYQDNPFEL